MLRRRVARFVAPVPDHRQHWRWVTAIGGADLYAASRVPVLATGWPPPGPAAAPAGKSPSSPHGRPASPRRCTTRPARTASGATPRRRSPPSSASPARPSTATFDVWRQPRQPVGRRRGVGHCCALAWSGWPSRGWRCAKSGRDAGPDQDAGQAQPPAFSRLPRVR